MKRVLLLLSFFSFVRAADAQIGKIPAIVTDAFSIRYPHATHVEWRDKLQYFQASFLLNGASISANFTSGGEWQNSERVLNYEQLPEEVKDGFQKSRYSDWQKNSFAEIQELGKPLRYRVNVQKSGLHKKNLYFDANGTLLKEVLAL
jgi:hypothetical protein